MIDWTDKTVPFQSTTLGSLQKLSNAANINIQSTRNVGKFASDKTHHSEA